MFTTFPLPLQENTACDVKPTIRVTDNYKIFLGGHRNSNATIMIYSLNKNSIPSVRYAYKILTDELVTTLNSVQIYGLLADKSKLLQLTGTAKVGQETKNELQKYFLNSVTRIYSPLLSK